jgi:hypothetical protein
MAYKLLLISSLIITTACGTLASQDKRSSQKTCSSFEPMYLQIDSKIKTLNSGASIQSAQTSDKVFFDHADDLRPDVNAVRLMLTSCIHLTRGKINRDNLKGILMTWALVAEYDQVHDIAAYNSDYLGQNLNLIKTLLEELKKENKVSNQQASNIIMAIALSVNVDKEGQDPKVD